MAANSGLEIEVDSRGSCLAVFDDEKVHQVLANLVGNAIKFTPSGGRIRIALREGDDNIVVSVEDTGKGIPENRISELFEEFAQLGREDSRKGTGLGLAICKKIIESHQGRIWAESVPGEGSRFSFSLLKPS
jgi:signal transduction histidine kinase